MVEMYEKYKDEGFVVLAFPCNQFAFQEPGTNEEIKEFAKNKGANFPLFSKINVNGFGQDPLYGFLRSQKSGLIKWNFTKFLVDREGQVYERYSPQTSIESFEEDIVKLLRE
eukprot:TRINITY_DN21_c0_g1_i1.p2 TRINITY_DN21_c0_g1~~TRINITY_DN21_c0_g1_i1.p2  ORF type:complete len:112 (-),score=32.84 TRINITY_DN21_c0_g1_i1:135-470(-)